MKAQELLDKIRICTPESVALTVKVWDFRRGDGPEVTYALSIVDDVPICRFQCEAKSWEDCYRKFDLWKNPSTPSVPPTLDDVTKELAEVK